MTARRWAGRTAWPERLNRYNPAGDAGLSGTISAVICTIPGRGRTATTGRCASTVNSIYNRPFTTQLSLDNWIVPCLNRRRKWSVMGKNVHPDKDIRDALGYAQEHDWTVHKSHGHAHCWGFIRCPRNDAACRCGEFCQTSIWSTPSNPTGHARQLRRAVDRCIHATHEER
jgi:hypothetical protein